MLPFPILANANARRRAAWPLAALAPILALDALANGYSWQDAGKATPAGIGDLVYVGADRGTAADDATQADPTRRPLRQAGGWSFDAADDVLTLSSALTLSGDFTLYAAVTRVSGASLVFLGSAATPAVVGVLTDNLYALDSAGGGSAVAGAAAGQVLVRVRRAAGSVYAAWTGSPEQLVAATAGAFSLDAVGAAPGMGVRNADPANRYAAIVAFGRDLSAADRAAAEAYFAGLGYPL